MAVFIHEELIHNIRNYLSVNNDDTESLCLETIIQKSRNTFIETVYRQPSGNEESVESYFGKLLKKAKNKITYFIDDFNSNLLDYVLI